MQSNYNTIIKSWQLEEFAEYFSYFDEIKYGDLNYDALWKWSALLDAFFRIYGDSPKFNNAIDIGGGLSPIQFILSNYGCIKNVDDCSQTGGKFSGWFPTKENDVFYIESNGFDYKKENIDYISSDILQYIKSIPDNSVDLYVDGCSLIHANVSCNTTFHDGIYEAGKHINRTLKPEGYFISTSDIINPDFKHVFPSMCRQDGVTYPDNLFKTYIQSGLSPLDSPDFEIEDFYKNFNNCNIPVKDAPFHKRLNPEFSMNKHLPKYHSFAQAQGIPMLISRFVFRKGKNENISNSCIS